MVELDWYKLDKLFIIKIRIPLVLNPFLSLVFVLKLSMAHNLINTEC